VSLLSLVVALLAKLPKSCLPFKLAMEGAYKFYFFPIKFFSHKKNSHCSSMLNVSCVFFFLCHPTHHHAYNMRQKKIPNHEV
jgi:hypothetical protein